MWRAHYEAALHNRVAGKDGTKLFALLVSDSDPTPARPRPPSLAFFSPTPRLFLLPFVLDL